MLKIIFLCITRSFSFNVVKSLLFLPSCRNKGQLTLLPHFLTTLRFLNFSIVRISVQPLGAVSPLKLLFSRQYSAADENPPDIGIAIFLFGNVRKRIYLPRRKVSYVCETRQNSGNNVRRTTNFADQRNEVANIL